MGWIWAFNIASLLLLIIAARRWGAAPERICTAALVFMNVGDLIYHAVVGRWTIYASVDVGHLVIDGLIAAVFLAVAIQANRVYPLWLAAIQLVSVIAHFAREANSQVAKLAYALMDYLPYYALLIILFMAIRTHAKRVRRIGPYPAWRRSSNPLRAPVPLKPPPA
ncbi:hypothetical protein ACT17R_03080 [Sphingopyxis sp. Q841]|uniref:hypothetical protein n=1 Tax=Sphingopyxis sp. Q841 TaxID=3458250 RepID=UPI0040363C28